MLGVLQPLPSGDPIDLLKHHLVVGRREACDIVLDFGDLSGRRRSKYFKILNSSNRRRQRSHRSSLTL